MKTIRVGVCPRCHHSNWEYASLGIVICAFCRKQKVKQSDAYPDYKVREDGK